MEIPLTKEYPVYNLLGPSVSVGQAIKDTYLYMYYLLRKGFVFLLFSFPTPLFMNTEHLKYLTTTDFPKMNWVQLHF